MKKLLFLLSTTLSTVSYSQLTTDNIQTAVNLWLSDQLEATTTYGDISTWNVSNVTDMSELFRDTPTFNDDISSWNTSNVTNMAYMFSGASVFNGNISNWDTSSVTNMALMFKEASSFNQPLNWNTSSVTNMYAMFYLASVFNGNISNWDTGNVTNMANMFEGASVFNINISNWDTSKLTNMYSMFAGASDFNKPLNDWDTSKVIDMSYMFYFASSFNQPLNWNTSSVTNMELMFKEASGFNGSIINWNTSSVTKMGAMFAGSSDFNQDLSSWDVTNVTSMSNLLNDSGLSKANYDTILNSWSEQDVQSDVTLGAAGINYCNGADARQRLIDTNGWIIIDAGLNCSTAGVDDQNQLDISIYPNPTSDMVYIEGNYTQLKVVIYNVLGKEILNEPITNSINISHLDNGVYILQLSDGVKLSTRKIIKN